MLVKLLRDARVRHLAGEVVNITSQPELDYLLSTGSATVLRAAAPDTPEESAPAEARETRTTKKATRKRAT